MTANRLHADDTPGPVLAKGKTRTGQLWTVVRDDSSAPRSAGRDLLLLTHRNGEHPQGF
jgi:transposase